MKVIIVLILVHLVSSLLLMSHPSGFASISIISTDDGDCVYSNDIFFPSAESYNTISKDSLNVAFRPPHSGNYIFTLSSNIFSTDTQVLMTEDGKGVVVTSRTPLSSSYTAHLSPLEKYTLMLTKDDTKRISVGIDGFGNKIMAHGLQLLVSKEIE